MNQVFGGTLPRFHRFGIAGKAVEEEGADAYLNPAIQGVNIAVTLPGGAMVRAVVSADVLKTHFGAGESAAEWIEVSRRHAGLLQWLAHLLYEETGTLPLVITCKTVEQQMRGERSRDQSQQSDTGRELPERVTTGRQVVLASAPARMIS